MAAESPLGQIPRILSFGGPSCTAWLSPPPSQHLRVHLHTSACKPTRRRAARARALAVAAQGTGLRPAALSLFLMPTVRGAA